MLRSPVTRGLLLPLLWILAACGGDARPAASQWPEGTVLVVEGEPILQAEVDEWLDTMASIETNDTLPSLRRLALSNIVLPRKVAGLIDPARRARALVEANRVQAAIEGVGTPPEDVNVRAIDGDWKATGLDVWALAKDMPVGEWSPVFETVGAFCLFRRTREFDGPVHPTSTIGIELVHVPFVDPESPRALIDSAFDQMKLEVIDEDWRELVPAHYLYRMRAQETE